MKRVRKVNKGYVVPFNKFNTCNGEPCCCEKRYYTKFGASTLFCIICNIICARKLFKTSSFCKKNGWDKSCRTCQQKGNFSFLDNDKENYRDMKELPDFMKVNK